MFSSDVGAIKPSPVIFEEALRAIDVPAERVLYVGDNYKRDVAGARGVGIDSVWISSDQTPPAGFDCVPNLIVADLQELPDR